MNVKTQNWKNFTDQHLHDWHGIWTRYTPTGDVKESFRSLRHFESNSDKTEIYQLNKYIYAEDNVKEESWHYNEAKNSLSNGMFHPQAESMRGYFFEPGHSAWLIIQLQSGSFFGMELFFRYQHLRHSVSMVYDEAGNLFRTANIREDSTGYPSSYWSIELNQLSQQNLSKNWQGTSITITPDLHISEPVPTQLSWGWQGHKTFFLPDGVSISCPEKVAVGTSFTCVANWLINSSAIHQLIANYDDSGAFNCLTLERCELK
ncbi:MAG: DUF3598 family protein [Cyanobacteria bacterium P01_G01_bin.49]